ncbi:MAG: hypoxanthine phosphoribosyltransferase [Bacteroidota bacterium]
MESVRILDKTFSIYLTESKINERVSQLAAQINKEYKQQEIVFVGILNGCFMFASDLFKQLEIDCKVSFLKIASYQGTQSTGKVQQLIGLNEDISNKTVIIIEDIIDTGITIDHIINQLNAYQPSEIKVASLLFKPEAYQKTMQPDYIGFEIPNKFIVGYGLDYNGYGRNLKHIYQIS